MARVFFASAIDGLKPSEAEDAWRKTEESLKLNGHELINNWEFYKGDLKIKGGPKAIVKRDLEKLHNSQVLLVDMSRSAHKYVGCIFEIAYAHTWSIPIAVFDPNVQYQNRVWLMAHVDKFFLDINEAFLWIKQVSTADAL